MAWPAGAATSDLFSPIHNARSTAEFIGGRNGTAVSGETAEDNQIVLIIIKYSPLVFQQHGKAVATRSISSGDAVLWTMPVHGNDVSKFLDGALEYDALLDSILRILRHLQERATTADGALLTMSKVLLDSAWLWLVRLRSPAGLRE
eukprot:6179819-Pleurochrysis_carterae.AAC.1